MEKKKDRTLDDTLINHCLNEQDKNSRGNLKL